MSEGKAFIIFCLIGALVIAIIAGTMSYANIEYNRARARASQACFQYNPNRQECMRMWMSQSNGSSTPQ